MEMNELYQEIGKMCEDWDFDAVRAEEILNQIDVNQEFTPADFHYKQTLLSWAAVFSSNLKMVKLLLNHGADPNQFYDNSSESVLWQMQYSEENAENYEEINKARLKIVELLLRERKSKNPIFPKSMRNMICCLFADKMAEKFLNTPESCWINWLNIQPRKTISTPTDTKAMRHILQM